MGGFFGVVSKEDCLFDLFFGTDYHSHLGTRRGGLAVYGENGFDRSIHNIENSPFRTKFDKDVQEMKGNMGIGCISDYEPQPLIVRSHHGTYAITTVSKINNIDEIVQDIFDKGQNSGVLLIDLHFQTRNCLQSRQLGCPEAALSRYQLPAVIPAADGQGLDDPVAADGFRQFRQRSGSEFPSGLVWVGSDLLHRKPTDLRVQHARHLLTGSETAGVPGSACIVAPGSGGNVGKSVGKIKKARKIPRFFCK